MVRLKRLAKSFGYAFKGVKKVYREEQNFKIELAVAAVVVLLSLYYGLSAVEMSIIFLIIGVVLLMEILNSVVELISDVLKPKLDIYVKQIKDLIAGAVLVASILAVVVGVIIFGPKMF